MKKKFNHGLIIGKFYPFHRGHQYLIETGLAQSQSLTVILCQTDRYVIPPEVRTSWLTETFPGLDVRIFRHDASLDSNSTDVSEVWAKLTVEFLGFVPDVVFSSESYGDNYAHFMGSKHVLVDLERRKFPISATKIRSDVQKYWNFLPETTRGFYLPKIVVLGAESTGTTTLAKDLAIHYQTVWVSEYGRFYYEGKMFTKNASQWQTPEFIHIATLQNQMEDSLIKKANRLLICDTDAFATTLWHERYVGTLSPELEKIVKREKPLLYIVTDVDIPFVQDGTRDGEHIRSKMHQRFIDRLKENNLPYFLVSGSKEKRLKLAIAEIDRLTSSQPESP